MKKILIVDNDQNTVKTIKASLLSSSIGYTIRGAFSGQEAFDAMAKEKFDIILLDLMMPGMSGIDVCKKMIEDDEKKNIPVLIVSALPVNSETFQESQGKFDELSVVKGVLEKPFEVDELLAKVEGILSK